MKIEIRQAVELAGLVAVLASLIFVGIQLRLDSRIAIATQYQARAESRIESLRSQFETAEYHEYRANLWEESRPPWWNEEIESLYESGMKLTDISRDYSYSRGLGYAFDNNFYQYEMGLMSEENWRSIQEAMVDALTNVVLLQSLRNHTGLRPEFQNFVQDTLNKM